MTGRQWPMAAKTGCGRAADGYLGADWRALHTSLVLFVPTAEQWGTGARWYRCDVMEFAGVAESAAPGFPETAAALDAAFGDGCRDRARVYTAMSADLMSRRDVTAGAVPTGEPSTWAGGDRSARCWVLLHHRVTGSVRGLGDVPD
ncbi:septum formation family protein [Dactylosporangium sp. CA-139066]|uniref:septum formation family protein n=1 Tax=Dactylosporangium sp. CA-139066 TaxID=3239930 RepID=UPI003D8DFDD7